MLPSGFWKLLIHSIRKLEVFLCTNLTVLRLLSVSSKNCKTTTEKSTQLAISYHQSVQ